MYTLYASTRAVNRWILLCNISKRIAICIAIFSLISLPTWFTLVSFLCAEKLWWKRYTWCWICQTRHIALLLCWRFENYVLVFEMVTEMCQLFYITCLSWAWTKIPSPSIFINTRILKKNVSQYDIFYGHFVI